MLKLSLREAVSSPAMQFAVIEAWLTLPDWVTRRTEIVELEDATTASHAIVLDITLPDSLREKLTIYPQQSDAGASVRERSSDSDVHTSEQGAEGAEESLSGPDTRSDERQEGGMVLLPALFLRRGMPLPRLGITLGQDEIKATYLPKELSDTLMQGVIALANDRPVPGPHQVPIQRFECECPEAAWQCKRSSCPGRSERDEELPNGKLRSCPPPTSPLRRYEWPYCPYAEEGGCTCVKERCPAATLTYPEVVGPDDRSLAAFLDSHLSTDYGMVIVAPESAVKGSFRMEISFTRELTAWVRPYEVQQLSEKGWWRNLLGLVSWFRKKRQADTVARCGPFQGVIERSSYPRFPLASVLTANGEKARQALGGAAAQTDRLKIGWKKRKRFLHGKNWIRRTVANHGASMTVGVQTSSLGDAGTFHFVFGAPKGMQITPSGGWIHDWPGWRRATLDEGIETLREAEPKPPPGFPTTKCYTDDFVPIDGKGDGSENPTPYVAFLPARGIDEKVAMRPTPSDLLPLAPPSDTKGPTSRFSPGASLLALIQFRPKTNLPFFGIVTNALLLTLILMLSLGVTEDAFLGREDAWIAVLLLAPALLAGITASRDHPVAAPLVRKYRIALGVTAALAVTLAGFLLAFTAAPAGQGNSEDLTDVPSLTLFPDIPHISLSWPVSLSPLEVSSPISMFSPSGDLLVFVIALASLIILVYSLFHLLVNRAAHRWADDYSVNQLDLMSPSRGFKLDTMRRPWCDPSPIRPEQALEELEALRVRHLGFGAINQPVEDVPTNDARHSGVDTLVFSSQELASTFAKSEIDEEDDLDNTRAPKKPRTEEQLREKYGVELPEYVPSETEMVFRDGRFFEERIHEAIKGSGVSFVNLSPRHARRPQESPLEVIAPTAADDDLDRYLMTLMAMEAGIEVIAEGCLMGRYTPPLGDPVGTHWLRVQLETATQEQLNRLICVMAEGMELLIDEGDGSWGELPVDLKSGEALAKWLEAPGEALAEWLKVNVRTLTPEQLDRLFEAVLRGNSWENVREKLNGNNSRAGDRPKQESWRDLKGDEWEEGFWRGLSPREAVDGLPIRRFKGFPDLLVRSDLLETTPDNSKGDRPGYVPIDIKQGNPFHTVAEKKMGTSTPKLVQSIEKPGVQLTLLKSFPDSIKVEDRKNFQDEKPQYLAQLGLYSVLLKQAQEILGVYPHRDKLPRPAEHLNVSKGRKELARFRGWITDEEDFAETIAPNLTIDAVPDDAFLWIARGDGDTSRLLPIPGPYLTKQLEKSVRDLVTAQAEVALNAEIAGV